MLARLMSGFSMGGGSGGSPHRWRNSLMRSWWGDWIGLGGWVGGGGGMFLDTGGAVEVKESCLIAKNMRCLVGHAWNSRGAAGVMDSALIDFWLLVLQARMNLKAA